MLIEIHQVLNENQLQVVKALVSQAHFVDGKLSAEDAAEQVKNNEEIATNTKQIEQLNNLVMGSLLKHPTYLSAALPKRVAVPYYARYTQGMSYGAHTDNPIMGMGEHYRSDIAITVFLSDDYEGGELLIQSSYGEHSVKLPAGDAILYPASHRHRVAEVTRGERLAAITWVQSMVRDANKRFLLHELNQLREEFMTKDANSEAAIKIDSIYGNLLRMWAQP